MILELRVKNFLSFKDEVVFSFEATKDKNLEDYHVVEITPKVRILRLAIIYGANTSGKSNLLNVFEFLRSFWLNITNNKDENTKAIPFLLDSITPNNPSEFSLTFYANKTKYIYSLKINQNKVLLEKLYFYSSNRRTLIFERKLDNNVSNIHFNEAKIKISQAEKDEIRVKCLNNMSVIAAYNQVNTSIEEIEEAINWMKNQYMPLINNKTNLSDYTKNKLKEDASLKEYILNFLFKADFHIADIKIEKVRKEISKHLLDSLEQQGIISKEKRLEIENETIDKLFFEHRIINNDDKEEFYFLPEGLESLGTIRTFGLTGVLKTLIDKNGFLAIDEIENSLHPKLIEFIIEDFLKHKGESQLLLTTHYDGLLEEYDLLRNDNIWFANKQEDGSTELYSLSDFSGLKRISSLQKAYKYGQFGAIPNI
ncbi:MAG: ATP-binding protein [Bacteroidales bacterium]|jgi:AAA15 family ATPase/GTPase|nr:ATP-binding protein [Bacteroidales bacterium]